MSPQTYAVEWKGSFTELDTISKDKHDELQTDILHVVSSYFHGQDFKPHCIGIYNFTNNFSVFDAWYTRTWWREMDHCKVLRENWSRINVAWLNKLHVLQHEVYSARWLVTHIYKIMFGFHWFGQRFIACAVMFFTLPQHWQQQPSANQVQRSLKISYPCLYLVIIWTNAGLSLIGPLRTSCC